MARLFLFALFGGLVVSAARAEDPQPPPDLATLTKVMEAAAQPGAEHQKLEVLAGNWTFTNRVWMAPGQPPLESSGTMERKWILGNRFLEENVNGKGLDGVSDFEGRGLIGYDNAQKKYTYSWACTMGTGTANGLGSADASGKVLTFDTQMFCPIRNKPLHGRDVVRIESNDKPVIESFEIEDGKETKLIELVVTRQK